MSASTTHAFDLLGKVALVTGGGRGLGFAISRALAAAGATTVLCDIDPTAAADAAKQITESTGNKNVHGLECDVQNNEQVIATVNSVVEQHGRIDVLVNNAGIHRRVDPLE